MKKQDDSLRSGFTLVEMLVSTALILFIMVILSQAFASAVAAYRDLKAIGDMQEKLRSAVSILRRDLSLEHFVNTTNSTRHTLRGFTTSATWAPPNPASLEGGFVRIWQGSTTRSGTAPTNDWTESSDGDAISSFRSTDHMLHFTIIQNQSTNNRENYFSAFVPDSPPSFPSVQAPWNTFQPIDFYGLHTYNSKFAEVAYFLRRATGSTAGATPLYALYRRQRTLLNDPVGQAPALNTGSPRLVPNPLFHEVSSQDDQATLGAVYFNTMTDVANPFQRFGMLPAGIPNNAAGIPLQSPPGADPVPTYPTLVDAFSATDPHAGDDLLLANVVSFDVQLRYSIIDVSEPQSTTDFFRDLPTGTGGTGTATVSGGQVTSVSVSSAGSGYNYPPAVRFVGGGGTGATAAATISGGQVTSVAVTSPGSGYTTAPTVDIDNHNTILSTQGTNLALAGVRVFDTWSQAATGLQNPYDYSAWKTATNATRIPNYLNIYALQITLRIWDDRTQKSRQITIIQEM